MAFRVLKRTLRIYLFFCFLYLPAAFSSSPGTSIFSFLKVTPAARSAGMGGVNGLISSQGVLSHPAALPWLGEKELSLQYLLYLSEVNYSLLTYVHPLTEASAFSTSLGFLSLGGLTRTVADNSVQGYSEQGSFAYSDGIFNIGFGQRISPSFSYGIALKAVRESIDGDSSSGAMFSLSGLYRSIARESYFRSSEDWQLGFGLLNIGPRVRGFELPAGGFVSLGKQINRQLFWIGELTSYADQTTRINTGFEYIIGDVLLVRLGYNHRLPDPRLGDFPVGLAGGTGFIFKGFLLDYSWEPYGDLGTSHRLGITAKWGAGETVRDRKRLAIDSRRKIIREGQGLCHQS